MAASCQLRWRDAELAPGSRTLWQASAMSNSPEQGPVQPTPTLDKKKSLILGAVGLAFMVLIFWKVIPQIGDYGQAWSALQAMGTGSMLLIAVMVLLYLLAYGLPFMAVTPGLRYWRSQQVNQAAFTISNGVPAGGAVGLAVQFGMLTSFAVAPTAATAAITAVGVWSTFVSLGFPILGVVALAAVGGSSQYVWVGIIGLLILVAAVVVFVLVMRSESLAASIGRLANKVINPFRNRVKSLHDVDAVAPITKFRGSMYDVLKRRWAAITAAQVAVSAAQFLILYVALRGVQGWDSPGTSIIAAFAAFAISQVMLMVPITPGGLGTVDALMISILISLGAEKGDATAADLVWRASSYVPQILIGIVALLAWTRRAGRSFAKASAKSTA
ncbi:MAG: flippase-like domain-containing protein [Actinobacteria bacterium]|nr:flippase-like domain-containing protein [Actinomycetota bacterium]